jgi:hypothetical protein
MVIALQQASRRLRVAARHATQQRLPKGYRRQIIIHALHRFTLSLSVASSCAWNDEANDRAIAAYGRGAALDRAGGASDSTPLFANV